MPNGRVKFWNPEKGFGFITPDDGGADVFVHITGVESDVDELQRDQRVSFEIELNERKGKTEAMRVRVL